MSYHIEPFFDRATFTYSYVVTDGATGHGALIDPVLDYDPAAGRLAARSFAAVADYLRRTETRLQWILETHVHADHLTAARRAKGRFGGRIGIGARVVEVQEIFARLLNVEPEFKADGSAFDRLFEDGDTFSIGEVPVTVMATPGHTPACVTYLLPGAAFVGDTIFMPDYGTARADFPGGDAADLYRSIRRILDLPEQTRLLMCHDYGSPTRETFAYETTVAEERRDNVMVRDGVSEDEFVAARRSRDAQLAAPALLWPSVQFNMRGGELPPAEENGTHYFKIPVQSAE